MRTEIERIVYEIREEQGGSSALGNCIENAQVLKAAFEDAHPEWSVSISYGAVDYNGTPAESYVQAKQEGELHHWVVVQSDDGVWHCDLASESESCWPRGAAPMIRRGSPPQDYIDFGHRRDS